MTRPGRIVALALLGAPVGCILFVSTPEVGDRCHFRGEDTACGACLVARCTGEIDAACAESAVLAPMEECAAAGDDACGQVPPSGVASCMAAQCGALCYARTGTSETACADQFLAPGLACSCQTSATPNDFACTSAIYTRTRCCAPPSWPGPALACACNAVVCVPTSDGCNCVLGDDLDVSTAEECRGPAHCCATGDQCQCRARACTDTEREVAVCDLDALACPTGTVEVAACSIRR